MADTADDTKDEKDTKIVFKKKSKKPLRRRQESSDESDGAEDGDFRLVVTFAVDLFLRSWNRSV